MGKAVGDLFLPFFEAIRRQLSGNKVAIGSHEDFGRLSLEMTHKCHTRGCALSKALPTPSLPTPHERSLVVSRAHLISFGNL